MIIAAGLFELARAPFSQAASMAASSSVPRARSRSSSTANAGRLDEDEHGARHALAGPGRPPARRSRARPHCPAPSASRTGRGGRAVEIRRGPRPIRETRPELGRPRSFAWRGSVVDAVYARRAGAPAWSPRSRAAAARPAGRAAAHERALARARRPGDDDQPAGQSVHDLASSTRPEPSITPTGLLAQKVTVPR